MGNYYFCQTFQKIIGISRAWVVQVVKHLSSVQIMMGSWDLTPVWLLTSLFSSAPTPSLCSLALSYSDKIFKKKNYLKKNGIDKAQKILSDFTKNFVC